MYLSSTMQLPVEYHPHLTAERLRLLSELIVPIRNAVMERARESGDDPWGTGCLAHGNVRQALRASDIEWLRFCHETGQGYTMKVGDVPLRITRMGNDLPVLPKEREGLQLLLFDDDRDQRNGCFLRLEVEQPRLADVDRLLLRLVDESTGEERESWPIYDRRKDLVARKQPERQSAAAFELDDDREIGELNAHGTDDA